MTTGRVRRVSSNSIVALSAFAATRALVITRVGARGCLALSLDSHVAPCKSSRTSVLVSPVQHSNPVSLCKAQDTHIPSHLSSNKKFKTSIHLSSVCVPSAERREMLVRDHADLVGSCPATMQGARLPCLQNSRHQSG